MEPQQAAQMAATLPAPARGFEDALVRVLADPSFWDELARVYRLTPRQVELARAICRADGTKEIARQWSRSIKTVEAFRLGLYKKLKVDSACAIARRVCGAAADFAIRKGPVKEGHPCADCPLRQAAERVLGAGVPA